MVTTTSSRTAISPAPARTAGLRPYTILVTLTAVVVLFQGVWAGMFIREGDTYDDGNAPTWVSVHDWGARLAFVLGLAAVVVAVVKLRHRADLVGGAAALTVLLFLESYLGGEIGKHSALTSVHIPLALLLVALSVLVPLRAIRLGRSEVQPI